jgi:hypothetical protein
MPGFRDFRFALTEMLVQSSPAATPIEALRSSLSVQDLDEFTYVPPDPLNTCSYVWRPYDFQATNTSPLLWGYLTAEFPDFTVVLSDGDYFGPFDTLYSAIPDDRFVEGPYTMNTIQFWINYVPFDYTWGGTYRRAAGSVQQTTAPELLEIYANQNGFISPDQAFEIVRRAALGDGTLAAEYRLEIDAGYAGTHAMSCTFGLDDTIDPEAARLAIRQQSWPILSTFLPEFFETAAITIRTFPVNNPQKTLEGDVVDQLVEVFDASAVLLTTPEALAGAITDCEAFATCP